MPAREYDCKVTSVVWLTPTCFSLRFEPSRHFSYQPGQFLSVILPNSNPDVRTVRRIYSFASPGKKGGYELCVQKVPDGRGSSYLASLKPGDTIRISAPFGDFFYETPSHRNACMIATSTGIAPFKAMVLSERFRKEAPAAAMLLLGVRNEKEVLFPGLFEKHGVEVVHAVSQAQESWDGFKGRVTDYLKALPESWPWQETDFYICGNGHMIEEVRHFLLKIRGVPKNAVRQEAYFSTHAVSAKQGEPRVAPAAKVSVKIEAPAVAVAPAAPVAAPMRPPQSSVAVVPPPPPAVVERSTHTVAPPPRVTAPSRPPQPASAVVPPPPPSAPASSASASTAKPPAPPKIEKKSA